MKTRVEKQKILYFTGSGQKCGNQFCGNKSFMVLSVCKSDGCKIIYCFTQFHEVELVKTMLLKINSAQWSEQESIEEEIMGVLTDDK